MHVQVEILVIKSSVLKKEEIILKVKRFILNENNIVFDRPISIPSDNPDGLRHIKSITVSCDTKIVWPPAEECLNYHVYSLHEASREILDIANDDGSENITSSNHWILPNIEFNGLWESLVYDEGIKENILKYVETVMLFSQRDINENLISCNRLVLLHGPPGTGKTSYCKALANKLSIRFFDHYKYIHLVEINSHSLFSKWFSESGKLVMKLFSQIREIVEHKQSFVIILIDEIESIAFERNSISSNEPSDSLRVVNAVLTQLDQIRKFSNVLILTTSNMTSAIDFAFLDRADIKQYIGPPSVTAIFKIYESIIDELVRCAIIIVVVDESPADAESYKIRLWKLAEESVGISGRTLRKLPLMAHAYSTIKTSIPMHDFLDCMSDAIARHKSDCSKINKKSPSLNSGI